MRLGAILAAMFLVATPVLGVGSQGLAQDKTVTKKPVRPAELKRVFDINSATKADLETLNGISPSQADAIVNGRPYQRKDELVRKKIISKEVYESIKLQLRAKRVKAPGQAT